MLIEMIQVLLAGIAGACAGAISMAMSEFIGMVCERGSQCTALMMLLLLQLLLLLLLLLPLLSQDIVRMVLY